MQVRYAVVITPLVSLSHHEEREVFSYTQQQNKKKKMKEGRTYKFKIC